MTLTPRDGPQWRRPTVPAMRDPRSKTVPSEWAGPIRMWCQTLAAAGRTEQTIGLRRAHVSQLARAVGGKPTDLDEERLLEWLGGQAWARETRRAWRASLRSFFESAGRSDLSAAVPSVRPSVPMPRPVPEPILEAAKVGADERTVLILRLAAEAGLRRGEIAQVHADDLGEDLFGPTLMVHGKGDRRRVVPLSTGLAAVVQLRAGGGWLLPGDVDGHLSAKWVGTLARRVLPGAWTLHTARHRFATRAHDASSDLIAVGALLGHASVATTQRYVATDAGRLRRVAMAAAA